MHPIFIESNLKYRTFSLTAKFASKARRNRNVPLAKLTIIIGIKGRYQEMRCDLRNTFEIVNFRYGSLQEHRIAILVMDFNR